MEACTPLNGGDCKYAKQVEEVDPAVDVVIQGAKRRSGIRGSESDDGDSDTSSDFKASLRGFLVILALSLHAVFEGVALGIAHHESSVWYLFFAIASHKFVISFCVGMQFINSGTTGSNQLLYR